MWWKLRSTYTEICESPVIVIELHVAYLTRYRRKLDLRISLGLTVKMRGVPKEDLERLVARAIEVCPIHKAIREEVKSSVNIVVME